MKSLSRTAGFTMVEVLVVVGILLVLSSIAAENYSRACTAAKLGRVKADLRTVAGAIEAYHADCGAYARMRHADFYGDADIDFILGQPVRGVVAPCLSTPIAYMSQSLLMDPYMADAKLRPLDTRFYTYQIAGEYVTHNAKSEFWPLVRDFYGEWRLCSVGPDQEFGENIRYGANLPYDPTNGAVSRGNIWRSHKWTDTPMPPVPGLLGTH